MTNKQPVMEQFDVGSDEMNLRRRSSSHVERIGKGFPETSTSESRFEGQERLGLCHALDCVCPSPNAPVEVLTPKEIESRGGPLGRR